MNEYVGGYKREESISLPKNNNLICPKKHNAKENANKLLALKLDPHKGYAKRYSTE
jgi:hypothetical protein